MYVLSCDPVYRSLVHASMSGDAAALLACSDYRVERGFRPLGRASREKRTPSAQDARRIVRKAAKAKPCRPVVVISGRSAPKLRGEPAYYTTPAGSPIFHPNAYKWAKVRHGSTIRVEVGRDWLLLRGIDPDSL